MTERFTQHTLEGKINMQDKTKETKRERELLAVIAYTQNLQKTVQENSRRLDAAYKKRA